MDNWDRLEVEGDALASATPLVSRRSERQSNYLDCKIELAVAEYNERIGEKKKMTASGQSFNNLEQIALC